MVSVYNGVYNYARDLYYNLVKPRKYPSHPTNPMVVRDSIMTTPKNGLVLPDLASTDLHLVADDLTSGSDWASRVGSFTAIKTGTNPTVGLESPLYPSGGFSGSGYRTAMADCAAGAYYKFAYDSAHSLTSSSTVTCHILLRLGVLANEEVYWSRYISASTKYNFRIYSKNDGTNAYRLYVQVDHSTTNAVCNRLLTQMGYCLLTFTYNGSTKVLTMYVNGNVVTTGSGNVGTSTGVGNIVTDTSSELYIGRDPSATPSPMVKGQILEVVRYQEILSSTTIMQHAQRTMGLQTDNGIYPAVAYIRNSAGFVQVNNKIWAFCKDWPLVNENGFYAHVSFGCTMYSTAITDGTGGISNLTITAGVTVAPEAGAINSQVNGQTLTIPGSGASIDSAMWFNFGMAQSVKGAATIVWRPNIPGSVAYAYIYDETTLKYWVTGTTWSLSPTAIDLSAFVIQGSGTISDPYVSNVPFTTEAFGAGSHRIDAFVHNNTILDASKSIKVYHCQICDSQQFSPEPLVVIHPNGGDGVAVLGFSLEYPSSVVNWNFGSLTYEFRPNFPSTQPRVSPSNALTQLSGGTSNNYSQMNIGSAEFRFKDNAAHVVTMAPTYGWRELLQFKLDWNSAGAIMVGQITNKAISGNAVFTAPLTSGTFRIGSASQSPGGSIKNIIIR